MALLDEIVKYRGLIMKSLCTDDTIIKNMDADKGTSLPYKKVFPYLFKPLTTTDSDTFITFQLQSNIIDKTIKELELTFYVFADERLLRTKDGLRTDILAQRIDRIFNGYDVIGLGKMDLVSIDNLDMSNSTYHGLKLTYSVVDLNRPTMNRGW